MLPKPEEVPKKPSSRGENLAKTCGGTKKTKKTKKTKFRRSWAWRSQEFYFCLVPPQVLTIFSLKTLPEPEEVPKNQSLEVKILPKPEEVPKKQKKSKVSEVLGLEVSRILVFFGTSSGFGKVFKKNIART